MTLGEDNRQQDEIEKLKRRASISEYSALLAVVVSIGGLLLQHYRFQVSNERQDARERRGNLVAVLSEISGKTGAYMVERHTFQKKVASYLENPGTSQKGLAQEYDRLHGVFQIASKDVISKGILLTASLDRKLNRWLSLERSIFLYSGNLMSHHGKEFREKQVVEQSRELARVLIQADAAFDDIREEFRSRLQVAAAR